MSERSSPMEAALAAALLDLAQRVRRLSPPSRRAPDRFTEDKDDVAAALEGLVRRHCPSAAPMAAPRAFPASEGTAQALARRRAVVAQRTIIVGSRRVMVQVRRAAFSLG